MIEPHSAQLGASSWILKATFALPSDSVTVPEPFPFPAFGAAEACPLVAMTANPLPGAAPTSAESEGEAAPTLGVPAGTAGEPALPVGASSFTAVAVGASGMDDDPRSAVGRST